MEVVMTASRFRQLVLALWGLALLYALASAFGEHTLPQALRSYVTARRVSAFEAVMAAIAVVVGVWNSYELYHFRRRSRVVFLVYLSAWFLFVPWLPPTVESSWAFALSCLEQMAVGALVVAMFWSPVADHFTGSRIDAA
jgi:hypothetical protein